MTTLLRGTSRAKALLVSALCALLLIVVGNEARVLAQTSVALDHFACYDTMRGGRKPAPLDFPVLLREGWGPGAGPYDDTVVRYAVRFCTPVAVRRLDTGEETIPIVHPNHRLTFYLTASNYWAPQRRPRIENQFGLKGIRIFQPEILAVPTQEAGYDAPENLNHFQCYRAFGPSVAKEVRVRVEDHYGVIDNASVGAPLAFCIPTEKIHDGVMTPIATLKTYLTCYGFSGQYFSKKDVSVSNQLATHVFNLREYFQSLCVPTRVTKAF